MQQALQWRLLLESLPMDESAAAPKRNAGSDG
jgi:hypothetical protein